MANFHTPKFPVELTKGNLPHWHQPCTWCFATFRLADSLPRKNLNLWKTKRQQWLQKNPLPHTRQQQKEYDDLFNEQINQWLDQGSGSCLLRKPEVARIVSEALTFFHGERHYLDSYVVMPNHVHVLFVPKIGWSTQQILKSWKSYSGRKINQCTGSKGQVWQCESWDRLIRNQNHFRRCRNYILRNPEKAGLKMGFVLWVREDSEERKPPGLRTHSEPGGSFS